MRKGAIADLVTEPTEQEYCQAAQLVARRNGEIPSPWLTAGIIAILLFCASGCFLWTLGTALQMGLAVLFVAAAVLVATICLLILPQGVCRRAQAEYRSYRSLRLPMKMMFGEDTWQTETAVLCSTDSYARHTQVGCHDCPSKRLSDGQSGKTVDARQI